MQVDITQWFIGGMVEQQEQEAANLAADGLKRLPLSLGLPTMSHICQTGRGILYCLLICMRDLSGQRGHFPHYFHSSSPHKYLWQSMR